MNILLHFGAVDYECSVWVNGQEVGHNHFQRDIAEFVSQIIDGAASQSDVPAGVPICIEDESLLLYILRRTAETEAMRNPKLPISRLITG